MIGRLTQEELADFTAFAQARQRHLMRTAFLLSGNRQSAQDLTQTALLDLCRSWRRVRRADDVDAYAHRVLINAFRTSARRSDRERKALWRKASEAAGSPADGAAPDQSVGMRLSLLAALDRLPPKARAVVVLRYWEDLSVEATAAALGCSTGTVKSQSSRALARLRALLGDGFATTDSEHWEISYGN
ncbi:RNA polymerase, sigma-24 subunit, ECF subfamily [Catenulispora acidiphila DSM 44928]|uniref:RNA polymerase, sigma-24 subunit, ECF subfamily n=1 Tax=Catenulispora acidiphila (strain DSM 44928 / JCM 14897 / NBRC 102108 / NRRL B-24433 / ID139908) TaxID=479433 RepID=C7QJ58_CATAD|nr:SigE family RNA polymerase sigma factor [Catenulispora acidiphila]ACU69200.1 RNA polymerase, sigma-24 subunit, ECF subfamily [Catenulispora acidiphila DSM 44928]